jgi:hypothetical protein
MRKSLSKLKKKELYTKRSKLPEGKGTHRSDGSNRRLEILANRRK